MGHPSPDGWTNTGSIQRCDIDGNNVITIIAEGTKTHTPKQLTIAEKSKKLYWCDREGMRVMRADLDGDNVETLVRNGDVNNSEHRKDYLRWCVGIQVDEDAGQVYWTQKGPPKILRCPINRAESDSDDIEVLFEKLPEPIDLCLDTAGGWLYWTDRGEYVVLPFLLNMLMVYSVYPLVTRSIELRSPRKEKRLVANFLYENCMRALDLSSILRAGLCLSQTSWVVYIGRTWTGAMNEFWSQIWELSPVLQ